MDINIAKEILDRLKSGKKVSQVEFKNVYEKITGKKYVPTTCVPCIKRYTKEIENRIAQIEAEIEKYKEVSDEEDLKLTKKKKKNETDK